MYLPPAATAITLAIASRRLVKQPVAAALDFYLGGVAAPALGPGYPYRDCQRLAGAGPGEG